MGDEFGLGNRKDDISPEELGSLLFSCADRWASRDAQNPGFLESVRANTTVDRDNLTQELLIAIMYAAMNVVMRKIKAEDKAFRVLDSMNNAFINRWKPEDRQKAQLFIGVRYSEYEDAQSEKRGPNQLWPLSHHILRNVLGKEAIEETPLDAVTMTSIVAYYSGRVIAFDEVLSQLRITS